MNVLLIMSDEQDGRRMGPMGWPTMHTPNLDALAERGTIFENTYCDSPLCVPSRASFTTGRHVSQIHCWDNASPFDDSWDTFGHRLRQQDVEVVTFGKLDFVKPCGDHGFPRYFQPSNREFGDVYGLFRDPVRQRTNASARRDKAGPKEDCTGFDDRVQEKALEWLRSDEPQQTGEWLLWVSFIKPHFPHYAPPEFYNLYDPDQVELPPADSKYIENMNQINKDLRYHFEVEEFVDEDTWIRNVIGYHALISYIDHQIGQLVETLQEQGLAEETLVIFCSDHGEMLGQHGMWWKCAPYEPSVRTPMVMAGPGIDAGRRVQKPVANVDMFPTLIDAFDRELTEADADLPGESLLPMARGEDTHRDFVLTQYHGHGVSSGWFALRVDDYKYIHYCNNGCELYNVTDDPYEMNDLSDEPDQKQRLENFDTLLHDLVDPAGVDANAKGDQAVRLQYIEKNMPEDEFKAKISGE